jgi:hypothetical protein
VNEARAGQDEPRLEDLVADDIDAIDRLRMERLVIRIASLTKDAPSR